MKCVFFFIPDCPACRASFPHVLDLNRKYGHLGLEMISILSDPAPDDSVLSTTFESYGYDLPIKWDTTLALARSYNATTTPQFLLFDSIGSLVYSGNLNNEYYSFGKHRARITENYLEDAIIGLLTGNNIEISQTDPIGCKINFN
jgi:hypothetical protein